MGPNGPEGHGVLPPITREQFEEALSALVEAVAPAIPEEELRLASDAVIRAAYLRQRREIAQAWDAWRIESRALREEEPRDVG